MSTLNEFARLVPSNDRAKRLFSGCYLFVQEDDPFHLHFMVTEGTEDSQDESSEETDGYSDGLASSFDSSSSQNSEIFLIEPRGYFSLTFGSGSLPEFPKLGWRVGRGTRTVPSTRNVDLLLTDPRDKNGRPLGSNHFRLSVNSESGFLVLLSSSRKRNTLKYFVEGEWAKLKPSSTRVMFQKSNLIRAGLCEYELIYTVDSETRNAFVKQRRNFIDTHLEPKNDIHLFFTHVPGDSRVANQKYVQFHTKGSGKFGWISQGLDTKTGNLIAIKEVRIQHKSDWRTIKSELNIGASLSVSQTEVS